MLGRSEVAVAQQVEPRVVVPVVVGSNPTGHPLLKADGTKDAFVVDRGKVTAESASSVTLARKDGVSVTLGLDADTKVRGDIQVDKGAVVFSRGGTAFAVLARQRGLWAPSTRT
jgi:hypothetical protein